MTEKLHAFLGPELSSLWADGDKLIASASGGFHDYSFVVFPFAKAYEGFLKNLFGMGAITERQFVSERWRVGKALNPQLDKNLRLDESVYDRLVVSCTNGKELADKLWQAWKRGRNETFHYYPDHMMHLSFTHAREIVAEIEAAMEMALESCKLT